jgi:undecaprenyl-diphosphatase
MSLIELLKYLFLGVVQGFFEILPISSSGHVAFFQVIFNIETDSGAFISSLLNLGSFLAIFIFFWKFEKELIIDLYQYVFKRERSTKSVQSFRYTIAMIIATVPVGIIGIVFSEKLYNYISSIMIGVGFLAAATLLYFTKDIVNTYTNNKMSYKDGLIIGLIQPIALIPGLSRLALTTCSGLLRKKSMETALRFSILLYLPISFGQLIINGRELIVNSDMYFSDFHFHDFIYYLVAFLAAMLVTFIALKNIFIWVRKGKFGLFSMYNAIIGLIAFVYGIMSN